MPPLKTRIAGPYSFPTATASCSMQVPSHPPPKTQQTESTLVRSRLSRRNCWYRPARTRDIFTVGGNRTVVYNTSTAAALSVLAWYDRSGKELARVGGPGVLAN